MFDEVVETRYIRLKKTTVQSKYMEETGSAVQ